MLKNKNKSVRSGANARLDKFKVSAKKYMKVLWRQRYLHLMVLPAVIALFIFAYLPMPGIQIAFRDYKFSKGIWNSPWVGLKHFEDFIFDPFVYPALKNTLGMAILKSVVFFPAPIIFALLLNEVRNLKYKKVIQTVSYLPYFISYVIIAVMVSMFLSPSDGIVNKALVGLGILDEPCFFLGEEKMFWGVATALEVWKNLGWGSIIYIAAIAGIDPTLYEAAEMDGAKRLQRMWYITLPSIKPTIVILFILNMGNLLGGASFDVSYLLGNDMNYASSEILGTYVMRVGLSLGRYSYATAVGLLLSVVSVILLFVSNGICKKITGESFM
ncbi:MAG: ABC transporter permease subunit [Lachnospiraceae bacterium]|nr:ABC transporter permease subunit [Lachnospiraceae bacterium]